jgi:hypothetical protein
MNELIALVDELEAVKSRQKALAEKEALIKSDLLELMKELGSEKEETDKGSVRIQKRAEKDYGPDIRAIETDLKERKKLAEDLGDYTVITVKESIVFTPPKDFF